MIAHLASWVLPVNRPPIRDGAVLVQGGVIRAVGPAREVCSSFLFCLLRQGPDSGD